MLSISKKKIITLILILCNIMGIISDKNFNFNFFERKFETLLIKENTRIIIHLLLNRFIIKNYISFV